MTKKNSDDIIKQLVLYSLGKRSLLLELFTILGIPNTLKLISYFGGTEIKIPSKFDVQRQIKQVYIHYMFTHENRTAYEIAKIFKMSEADVESCVKSVNKLCEELKLENLKTSPAKEVTIEELQDFILNLEESDYEEETTK